MKCFRVFRLPNTEKLFILSENSKTGYTLNVGRRFAQMEKKNDSVYYYMGVSVNFECYCNYYELVTPKLGLTDKFRLHHLSKYSNKKIIV